METSTIMATEHLLQILALIIFAGAVSAKLGKLVHLPDVVMFIIAGMILGPYILNLVNVDSPLVNQLVLTFGAAYILYDGGREISLSVLNKVKVSVALLATVGVIVSALITGYCALKLLHIDFTSALLLGAVVAATDPSVLVPLFKGINVSDKLKQTIISESAFNDAAAAIATFTILGIIAGGTFSLTGSLWELAKNAGGGIIVGVAAGLGLAIFTTRNRFGFLREFAAETAVAAVAGAYIVASHFGASGFMAVFVIGIIYGNLGALHLSEDEEQAVTHLRFKDVVIMILRMLIFILLGTQVDFGILAQYWQGALLVVLALIFVARPVSVLVSVLVDRSAQWTYKEILYLMWVRETGVIPAALAGMLVAMNIPNAQIISAVTFMAIIITLTVQASSSKYLAKILGLQAEQTPRGK